MTVSEKVDVVIVGAGVIGLSIAAEIGNSNRNVLVVEKNRTFGQETSSRSSEVIHGGLYYPTGTLKAVMCVEGRRLLYELCEKNNISHSKVGKLIVATDESEIFEIERLLEQGRLNGVEGLKILSKKEISALEPNVSGLAALYSEETGIIDSHRLMQYFTDAAEYRGVNVVYDCEVKCITKDSGGYKILVRNGSELIDLETEVVINCAGLDSDTIAQMIGIDTVASGYDLHYCKGQYFRISSGKAGLINRLIYLVPKSSSGGLGVHATLDFGGGVRLGPDDTYLDAKEKDYSVDENKKDDFYVSAKKFLPFISEDDLSPDTAGIRPKLQQESGEFRDFVVREESEKGLPGFINLIGIESPGLTACEAIAQKVQKLLFNGIH